MMKKEKTKKKNRHGLFGSAGPVVRVTITGIIMAALIVSFYGYLSAKLGTNEEGPLDMTNDLQICLTKDFVADYPPSAREVVNWYNRIITLYYSEDLKDKQIEALCDQNMLLWDMEMVADNPRDIYVAGVKQEIKTYKDRKKQIVTYNVEKEADVEYVVGSGGDDFAFVTSYYLIQEASTTTSSYQTYCLKRDGSGKYKILSFKVTDENGN